MSKTNDEKRYYWLKLPENFFDDDTMSFIEELPNGIAYSNFYLKLCLKSLQNEGILMRTVGSQFVPYDLKSLSRLTGVEIDTVKSALEVFVEYGLIQILDSEAIYIPRVKEMIGSESAAAERMRKLRDKKKLEELTGAKSLLPETSFDIEDEDEPW